MRKSTVFISIILVMALLFTLSMVHGGFGEKRLHDQRQACINLVKDLGLSDPALFTGASYIRHLSQADRHTPFKDHPLAFEHFPSGTFIQVPGHLIQ